MSEAEKLEILREDVTSIRGEMYKRQLKELFAHIEDDIEGGLITAADVLNITSPWTKAARLERAIVVTFLQSSTHGGQHDGQGGQ